MDKKKVKIINKQENFTPNYKGEEIIKFIAKTLPHQPGVYQMEDEEGHILYIGKKYHQIKNI